MSIRRFEFSEGASNKFWEVWTQGSQVFTRYGKLGAGGQTTIKETASADAAAALETKLVREKTAKGCLERGAAVPSPVIVATPVEAGFERYEHAGVFWEIKTVALRQRIRTGKIGTPGTLTEKFFDSSGDAKTDTKAVITAKVKQGFRPAKIGEQTRPTQRDPAIEATIEKNLDDARGYLVYADWLQGNSDPLGELIVLQHKGLTKQSEALLKKHAAHFWGALAKPSERTVEPEWFCGFLSGLKLGWPMYEGDGETEQDCIDDLTALLTLPIARFLRRLELGPVTYDGVSEGMSFQAVIDVMQSFKLPTLRELVLGHLADWDISSTSTGAFGPLAKVLPSLQRLTLRAGHIDLGKNVSLPELTHLSLETGSLTKNTLKQLWSLQAPKLESLMIWFGDPDHGASGGVKDLEPLLSGSLFPQLKHLGLMNASFTDQLPDALAKSLRLPQLESLDLSLGTLTDDGLARMLSNQSKFTHLKTLNLERNALSKALKKKSATLAKQVLFGSQDEERVSEDGRYPAVGE